MPDMCEVEFWVIVDENGDSSVSYEESKLADDYEEQVEGDSSLARRVLHVTLQVPKPTIIEVTGTVPPQEEPAVQLTVK